MYYTIIQSNVMYYAIIYSIVCRITSDAVPAVHICGVGFGSVDSISQMTRSCGKSAYQGKPYIGSSET